MSETKPALLWAATPNPARAVTLVELSSCLTCSRVVERVVRNEYGRSTPCEDGGEYEWLHRESRALACEERDVARTERALAGRDCQCPYPNPDCMHPTCPRAEPWPT